MGEKFLKYCILTVWMVVWFGSVNTIVSYAQEDKIAEGVYAGQLNLSGMTQQEAQSAIEDYMQDIETVKLTAITNKKKNSIKLKSLGLSWENPEIVDEAMSLAKGGNLIARFKAEKDLIRENQTYQIQLGLDEKKVNSFIKKKLEKHNQDPVEPTISRKDDVFTITDEEDGIEVNEKETAQEIQNCVASAENLTADDALQVTTVCTSTKPKHKAEELKDIKDLLGSCKTTYDSGNVGRSKSLEVSANRLDGTIIYPGETISVSALMGPRTAEGGYGVAQGYISGGVSDTVGAGICQTASTLYDAALYAELTIAQRQNHSLIVHYVDYSMDATIYAGDDYLNPEKDLKLKNDYSYPVYIDSYAGGGVCRFNIYGKETRAENREVEYVSTTLSETWPSVQYIDDPTHYVGYYYTKQNAFPAVKSTLTKIVRIDGKETERTVINTDTYSASAKKIVRGTKQKVTTKSTQKDTTSSTSSDSSSSSDTE
jgi:vancomycin resistance protein YoaR